MKHPLPVELFLASAAIAAFLIFVVYSIVWIVDPGAACGPRSDPGPHLFKIRPACSNAPEQEGKIND
jgi:hypothetical protein